MYVDVRLRRCNRSTIFRFRSLAEFGHVSWTRSVLPAVLLAKVGTSPAVKQMRRGYDPSSPHFFHPCILRAFARLQANCWCEIYGGEGDYLLTTYGCRIILPACLATAVLTRDDSHFEATSSICTAVTERTRSHKTLRYTKTHVACLNDTCKCPRLSTI